MNHMKTSLHRSPFAILGVTTRDDRRRIVEVAEERSLDLDQEICQKARTDLTNPRNRLSVEIAWLPGVSPRKASQLVENISGNVSEVLGQSGLPTLAHLNLLISTFELIERNENSNAFVKFVTEVADLAENIDPEDVLRDINEDRAISGFPEVRSIESIELEISERKLQCRNVLKEALNNLPPLGLIEVMTKVVQNSTSHGEGHAPALIDDLVDSYEVETQGVLQSEAENVQKLIEIVRKVTYGGEKQVEAHIDKIESVVRNWDKIAQPIQLSAKARGTSHEPSVDLAYKVRGLAVELFNKHDMLTHTQRLTALIQELFSEVPEVLHQVETDTDALTEIFQERRLNKTQQEDWANEITYTAEVGVVFKDTLSISPQGISWKGKHFPLESIIHVRWGGVSHSVNGIPTGTTYKIVFGNRNSEAVVELRKKQTFNAFTDKLWRAVCIRLLGEMLEALNEGYILNFQDASIHDDGVTLIRRKLFGSNESIRFKWQQVQVWSSGGFFVISSKENKKLSVSLSYIDCPNTHILEQAIRMAFKKPGCSRLSDVLR